MGTITIAMSSDRAKTIPVSARAGFCAQYQTVYDSFPNKLNENIAQRQNLMVKRWVNCGWWDTRDVIYVLSGHTNDGSESLTNWKNPGTHDGTLQGTPSFVPFRGFTCSSGNFIKTGYIPSIHGVNTSLDSISHGVWVNEAITTSILQIAHGVYSAAEGSQILVFPSSTLDDFETWSNSGAGSKKNYEKSYPGYYGGNRVSNTVQTNYINHFRVDLNEASVALPAKEIYVGARTLDGVENATFLSELSLFHIGGAATQVATSKAQKAFDLYMKSNSESPFGDIVLGIVGDSISDVLDNYPDGYPDNFVPASYNLNPFAYSGANIIDEGQDYVDFIVGDVYDIIIIALGSNDNNGGDMGTLQTTAETMIDTVRTNNPNASVYWMNALPRWTDVGGLTEMEKGNIRTAVEAACTAQGITCWDTYTVPWIVVADTLDGSHPTVGGGVKIYNEIIARI